MYFLLQGCYNLTCSTERHTMKTFKPTQLQQAFFDWVQTCNGSCVLEAVAGSGKTTTLIEALKLMKGTIFFGAYNKKIAEEIAARAPTKIGLEISTLHAAGFRAWKTVSKYVKVDGDKMKAIFDEITFQSMSDGILRGPVIQLVSYAKQAGVGVLSSPSDRNVWKGLIDHFDVECFDERTEQDNTDRIIALAFQCLKKSCEQNTKIIDFDDMIFAPLFHNVSLQKFDWILIDEAQDTNASRRELCLRMMHQDGKQSRVVAVGDRHQAIYGFTGADSDALDLIVEATKAIRLPLTTSFRCPKSVIAYARTWVSHIDAAENAKEGIVRSADIMQLKQEARVGDVILCRFNAPLVKHVYKLIAAGIPAKVEGREIGQNLIKLANRWKVKSMDALLAKLEKYEEREVKKFKEKEQERRAQDVQDQVTCLRVIIDRVIAKGVVTVPPQLAIKNEIESIFGDDANRKDVVLLSSIHKSKGREWSRVIWLQTKPCGFARQDWQIVQEDNLNYVAATRSMEELVLIDISNEK